MAEEQRDTLPETPGDNFAAAVRIPDYYVDSPQAWFRSITTTFAINRVTNS
jgi:hypothetical protein